MSCSNEYIVRDLGDEKRVPFFDIRKLSKTEDMAPGSQQYFHGILSPYG